MSEKEATGEGEAVGSERGVDKAVTRAWDWWVGGVAVVGQLIMHLAHPFTLEEHAVRRDVDTVRQRQYFLQLEFYFFAVDVGADIEVHVVLVVEL